jgi:hypothetical protein
MSNSHLAVDIQSLSTPSVIIERVDNFRSQKTGTFWSTQIWRAREAVLGSHGDSRHALAGTLFAAYEHGHGADSLSEALDIFRDLYRFAPEDDALVSITLDLGEALYADHRRTGYIQPVNEILETHSRTPRQGLYQTELACQHTKALLARCAYTGNEANLPQVKCTLGKLSGICSPKVLELSATYHIILWRARMQYDLEELRCLKRELLTCLPLASSSTSVRSSGSVVFHQCDTLSRH